MIPREAAWWRGEALAPLDRFPNTLGTTSIVNLDPRHTLGDVEGRDGRWPSCSSATRCEFCAVWSIAARECLSAFVSNVLLLPSAAIMSCKSFLLAVDMRENRFGSLSGIFTAGDFL